MMVHLRDVEGSRIHDKLSFKHHFVHRAIGTE